MDKKWSTVSGENGDMGFRQRNEGVWISRNGEDTPVCICVCTYVCVIVVTHVSRMRRNEYARSWNDPCTNKCTSVFNMRVTIFHFFFFLFRYGGILLLLLLLLLLFDVSSVTKGDGRMYQGVRKTYRHAATQRLSGKLRLLPVVFALFVMGRTWRR